MSKTTIQLTEATKAELDNLKNGDLESYEQVLQRIIREYSQGGRDSVEEDRMREIAREEVRDSVVVEALE